MYIRMNAHNRILSGSSLKKSPLPPLKKEELQNLNL